MHRPASIRRDVTVTQTMEAAHGKPCGKLCALCQTRNMILQARERIIQTHTYITSPQGENQEGKPRNNSRRPLLPTPLLASPAVFKQLHCCRASCCVASPLLAVARLTCGQCRQVRRHLLHVRLHLLHVWRRRRREGRMRSPRHSPGVRLHTSPGMPLHSITKPRPHMLSVVGGAGARARRETAGIHGD